MRDTTNYKIFTELADLTTNYKGSTLEKIEGLRRSQYQVIKMCEYYSDSRYFGSYAGNKKQIGDGAIDVPFYNIVNFRVAIAKTATDLDIKDIQIVSDNPEHQVESMLLNRECFEWMKDSEFSKVLNLMGTVRPKYGGYLIKKTEDEEGELKIEVVRWTNVMTDQNDILGGPIAEIHHMSPVEINKKKDVWDNVIDVLKAHKRMKSKERPSTIDVIELTGEFPIALFRNAQGEEATEDEMYTYSLQKYFIAELDGKKYLMYSEELDGDMCDYYEYLSWEDNGYGLGRGVIEDSEEAQVWTNDAVINESLAMALAGRVGVKTTSKKLGNSILEHDFGKIYELNANEDMEPVSFTPGALGQFQNQIDKWEKQANNVTSSFDSVTGEQPPANTPYSQTVFLNQVANRPFDYKREEWGIHLSKIFNSWVIPYLTKKISKEHILVSEFTDTELEMIDESFANYNANQDIIDAVLDNKIPTQQDQQSITDGYKAHIKKQGKKRYIEVPDGYFDDIDCKVTVVTTGEEKNKGVILQSLSEIMKTVIGSFNPTTGTFGVLEDPVLSKIFNQILELSGAGISPISIGKPTQTGSSINLPPPPTQQAPVQQGAAQMPSTMSPNMMNSLTSANK